MMPDDHYLDAPVFLLIENMIRKISKICPPHDFPEGWEVLGVRQRLGHRRQHLIDETIRKLRACLDLIVVENLPNIPNRKSMVNHFHADRPKAAMNSS